MNSKKSSKNLHQHKVMWKEAADDARSQLANLKVRASKLRAAIRFCEDSFRKGEPWPGETKAEKLKRILPGEVTA